MFMKVSSNQIRSFIKQSTLAFFTNISNSFLSEVNNTKLD